MNYRRLDAATQAWRDRLNHQFGTGEADQQTIRIIFILWLVAFLLKHSGSAWDVAWHFRYVFGALEPPHWLNLVGNTLAIGLIIFQTMTGKAVERTGFLVLQGAFVVFLIHMPLDVLNHYLFGLDVTVWSPTHILGFAATTVMMGGLLYSWLKLAEPGRWRLVIALLCWAFLLDDVMFMLSQQEYGVIALDAYAKGLTTASPELLAQAGRNPEQFVQGGIPAWVYPVWLVLTSTAVLLAARRLQGWRWSATSVALIYLAYRVIGRVLLGAFDFPVSFIPPMILPAALALDLAVGWRWSALSTALALVGIFYTSAMLIDRYTLMPNFVPATAPLVFLVLWGGLASADWWRRRGGKIAMQAV
ncbi:MAG TPA: hypothetical protein VFU22_28890 [Roseiflexaceae bacterium]|nr:hypothetical protein [Roseiflexaceae bacterium]